MQKGFIMIYWQMQSKQQSAMHNTTLTWSRINPTISVNFYNAGKNMGLLMLARVWDWDCWEYPTCSFYVMHNKNRNKSPKNDDCSVLIPLVWLVCSFRTQNNDRSLLMLHIWLVGCGSCYEK